MRVAYLVNQYPMVSHSFIRREIHALERQGFDVERISLRGWEKDLVDPADLSERQRTQFVLQKGALPLMMAVLRKLVSSPVVLMRALVLACRMGWRAERPLPVHLVYLAEACLIESWLRRARVQHVHAHFSTNPAEVAMLVHALGGPPWSFTAHGVAVLENPGFIGLSEKVRRSAFVVGICSFTRGQLMRFVDRKYWPKLQVVHCGLEPAFHAGPANPPPAARRLVCVGRLCNEKAQLILIEAAQRLATAGIKFELVLGGDGELRPDIEALIARYKLQHSVRITGWLTTEQVRNELLAARALVLPSLAEGLPVVIMEAMALRRPVISTFIAGIPELVIPGEHGWLVPASDVDALAQAMLACLDAPLDTLARMGEAARERVLERHDVDAEAAKLATLIRNGVKSEEQEV
jgi:glycosyltransferase involved in cell wall biosynthesis